jgi:hypothetical protein
MISNVRCLDPSHKTSICHTKIDESRSSFDETINVIRTFIIGKCRRVSRSPCDGPTAERVFMVKQKARKQRHSIIGTSVLVPPRRKSHLAHRAKNAEFP